MKVILYMATTINGFIAKTNDDTTWISKEEWDSYSTLTRSVGNLIMGRRTYEIITKQPEFPEFERVKIAVVSEQEFPLLQPTHHLAHSPEEALALFTDVKDVVVAGGGMLNAAFLEKNLVDEIYIDVEPKIFGKGIPLFNGADFDRGLRFIDSKKITENEIQLHYAVEK